MTITRRKIMQGAAAAVLLASAFVQPALAAVEVAGVKFADTANVGGQELKLNGAGVRTKIVFKVYAVGFYLQEHKTAVQDVLNAAGPRRIQLVSLRDLTSDEFGQAFMAGLNANTTADERTKYLPQTKVFGEMFGAIPALKKGDVLIVDWVPNQGTLCTLNGKKVGEVVPDVGFYNAIMKIWIGDKPVDSSLKPKLLGGGEQK